MAFSEFLDGRRNAAKELVKELGNSFSYVSVLGTDVRASLYTADFKSSNARDGAGECGFALRMWNGGAYFEYSLDDISGDIRDLAKKIVKEAVPSKTLTDKEIKPGEPLDEPLVQSFCRENDFDDYSDEERLAFCKKVRDMAKAKSDKVVNATGYLQPFTVSKLFVSKNRELDQYYGWVNAMVIAIYNDGKIVRAREDAYSTKIADVMAE